MSDDDSPQRDPLSPYYPGDVPEVPGNGRTWFAVLIAAMLLLGAAYGVLSLLFL
jgi:hypothetical protein